MKRSLYPNIIFFLLLNTLIFAQNQNKLWYFGNHAGLNFTSGSPTPISGSAINTNEGCASIADNNGNLLFYSDGITVWNRLNQVMTNGTGLLGNPSTTQSALIIPMPGNNTKYYLFAIGELGGAMTYSIIDMSLAAGLGAVTTTKNILLHSNVSEKQCAFQRCDGNIWIISHESFSNNFFADLISPAGIAPSVVSSVGASHAGGGGGGTFNTVGQMKFSQQGNRIALAIRDVAVFQVFDFNITSGVINNPISINSGSYPVAYGVEFSPDGTKLYGGIITGSKVYQFNLLAGSSSAISSSATLVGNNSDFTNSLQLAPDGKIYVAKSFSQTTGYAYLDVINNPNLLGTACAYVSSSIPLGIGRSLLGLPNFMVTTASSVVDISVTGITQICTGDSSVLTASGGSSYIWSGGSSATTSSIVVAPTANTTYYVTGTSAFGTNCGTDTDTITVSVNNQSSIPNFRYAENKCTNAITFQNLTTSSNLSWDFGDGSSSNEENPIHVFSAGSYIVTLIINPGSSCADTISQTIFSTNEGSVKKIFPNVFTPNGDGLNDEFIISGISECENSILIIYNRWGQKVFETSSPSEVFWNGTNGEKKEIVEGLYFYIFSAQSPSSQTEHTSGHVTVLK